MRLGPDLHKGFLDHVLGQFAPADDPQRHRHQPRRLAVKNPAQGVLVAVGATAQVVVKRVRLIWAVGQTGISA